MFVLAQFFLGQLLQGRTEAVQRLQGQVQDLTSQLGLEQDAAAELRRTMARINADLQQAFLDRDELSADLGESEAARAQLGEQVTALNARPGADAAHARGDAARAGPVAGPGRPSWSASSPPPGRRVTADKGQIELQLGQLTQLRRDIEALQKVRTDLEAQGRRALDQPQHHRRGAAAGSWPRSARTRDRASALEAQLADAEPEDGAQPARAGGARPADRGAAAQLARTSRASSAARPRPRTTRCRQVQQLTQQIATLSQQLAALDKALDLKQTAIDAQSATIADLGQRLNVALASKVEELSQYRSEFFGELRKALGDREDVRIVGDRFVFQSEVLFDSGSADIAPGGRDELAKLATALKEIIGKIPPELPWVLQVDGHTDRVPISTPRFPTNWELSTARAIAVAQFLISQGIPPDRVAARGFAEFQPLDPGEGPDANRRNRRIEIKLTTR